MFISENTFYRKRYMYNMDIFTYKIIQSSQGLSITPIHMSSRGQSKLRTQA